VGGREGGREGGRAGGTKERSKGGKQGGKGVSEEGERKEGRVREGGRVSGGDQWKRVRTMKMRARGQMMCVKLHSLEVVVYSALDPVGLQAEVDITTPPVIDVVLVEYIIQALIQVLQIQ